MFILCLSYFASHMCTDLLAVNTCWANSCLAANHLKFHIRRLYVVCLNGEAALFQVGSLGNAKGYDSICCTLGDGVGSLNYTLGDVDKDCISLKEDSN